MRVATIVFLAGGLGACAATRLEMPIREVAGSGQCNTPAGTAAYQVLADANRVRAWQDARSLSLVPEGSLRDTPYVVIEMGHRPTGGYRIDVEPRAEIRDGTLIITADFKGPEAGAMVTQALTSPCKLIELPAGDFERVEVRGPAGTPLPSGPSKPSVPAS